MTQKEFLARIEDLFASAKAKPSEGHKKFVATIGLVPKGSVASYGQIAKLAGLPGQARQVVWTLHSSSKKYRLPWHRIINSQGKIGQIDKTSYLRQKGLLQREGIEFDESGKVDLQKFSWKPKASELKKILKRFDD